MKPRDEELQRKWESLGISNDFIFGKVMQDKELCAELLRRILPDLDIEYVEFPEKQKTIRDGIDSRGVRLDIFTRSFSCSGTGFELVAVPDYFIIGHPVERKE